MRLNFDLIPWQQEAFNAQKRITCIEGGRQSGKSYFEVPWQLDRISKSKCKKHWYVAETYKQAYEILWDDLLENLPRDLIDGEPNKRELMVPLIEGHKWYLKGSDKLSVMRGQRLGSLCQDEACFQRPDSLHKVLRPMLARYRAPYLGISSSKVSWFTKYVDKIKAGKVADALAMTVTIEDNPYIDREEIEQIRATTPEDEWLSEYMCVRLEGTGIAYPEFNEEASIVNVEKKFPDWRNWKIVRGFDYGKTDDSACAFLAVSPEGYVVLTREHSVADKDVAWHCDEVKEKSIGLNTDPRRDVIDQTVYRSFEADRQSVGEQFERHLGQRLVRSEKDKSGGKSMFKRFMRGDGETPWFYVDRSCKKFIKGAREWEHQRHEPDILAAARYGIVHAVNLKLTHLADTVPKLKTPALGNSFVRARMERHRMRANPWDYADKKRTNQWRIDSEGLPHGEVHQ